MNVKGRGLDIVFVERLWRSVKYEETNLKRCGPLVAAHAPLDATFRCYNGQRSYPSLGRASLGETSCARLSLAVNP